MIIHKIIFGPVACFLDREARDKAKEAFLRVHSKILQVLESQKDDFVTADSIGYILERFVTNVEPYRLDCKKPAEVLVETMLKAIHGIFSINRGGHQETPHDAPKLSSLARSSMI